MIPRARLIILGDSTGKGTAVRRFVGDARSRSHISTATCLRTAGRARELGVMAKQVMNTRGLVETRSSIVFVDQRLSALDAGTRLILDDFPPPIEQRSVDDRGQRPIDVVARPRRAQREIVSPIASPPAGFCSRLPDQLHSGKSPSRRYTVCGTTSSNNNTSPTR